MKSICGDVRPPLRKKVRQLKIYIHVLYCFISPPPSTQNKQLSPPPNGNNTNKLRFRAGFRHRQPPSFSRIRCAPILTTAGPEFTQSHMSHNIRYRWYTIHSPPRDNNCISIVSMVNCFLDHIDATLVFLLPPSSVLDGCLLECIRHNIRRPPCTNRGYTRETMGGIGSCFGNTGTDACIHLGCAPHKDGSIRAVLRVAVGRGHNHHNIRLLAHIGYRLVHYQCSQRYLSRTFFGSRPRESQLEESN